MNQLILNFEEMENNINENVSLENDNSNIIINKSNKPSNIINKLTSISSNL